MPRLKRRELKPLNAKRVKEGAARTNSKYDSIFRNGVNTLKMKVGVNNLRIVRGTDADYWGETIWVHSYVGVKESSYICPKRMGKSKKCPICDAADDASASGDKEEATSLVAKERVICYIVNRDDEKSGIQVWDMSWSQGREIDAVCDTRRGILNISDHNAGFDISIQRTAMGKATRYVGLQVDRESSPLSEDARQQDAWIDEIDAAPLLDLLKYYPEQYLSDILTGKVEEKDEDTTGEEDRKPTRHPRNVGEDEGVEVEEDSRTRRRATREYEANDQDPQPRGRRTTRDEEDNNNHPVERTRARSTEAEDADDHEAAEAHRWRQREPREATDEDGERFQRRARREQAEDEDQPTQRRREESVEEEKTPQRGHRTASNGSDDDLPPRTTTRSRRDDPEGEERPTRRRREQPEEEPRSARLGRREEPEEDQPPRRPRRERSDDNEYTKAQRTRRNE